MSGPEPVRLCTEDGIVLSADYYAGVSGAPAYLLGHGFTGSSARPEVRFVAGRLNERGNAVLALSFRGHGTSGGASSVGVDEVADVAAGLRWLRERGPDVPVVTLGFSMGASVVVRQAGLAFADGGPVPDAVIAVSGPGRWYERGTVPMRRLHFGVETWLGKRILARFFSTRIGRNWELLPVSPVEVAGAIECPLLIVHGDADPYFPLAHPRMLAGTAPHAELWIEPGMGHAENATGPGLLDRMDGWAHATLSATMER
ncbi:MAG TPA: alpha/beta fold hydrolase [Jatrophihabitans sp.]|nr:alpha/beta fold hydrolase [Jatrophihabitans sp.]